MIVALMKLEEKYSQKSTQHFFRGKIMFDPTKIEVPRVQYSSLFYNLHAFPPPSIQCEL